MIVRYIHSTTSRSYDQNCDKWCDRKRWRRLLCKGKTNWSPKSTYYNVIGFIASWMDLFVLFIMLYTDWILKVRSVLKVIIAVLRRCTQHVALIAHMIIGNFFFFYIQYDRNLLMWKIQYKYTMTPSEQCWGLKIKQIQHCSNRARYKICSRNRKKHWLFTAEPWGVGTPPAVRKRHQQLLLVGVGHAQSKTCCLLSKSTTP